MPNFGWRLGVGTPKTNKLLDQVAEGLDTMGVFERGRCTSPVKCSQPGTVLAATLVGDAIAVGLYCADHASSLIERLLKLAKGGGDE